MANESPFLIPSFADSPGANTAVLPENNSVLTAYFADQDNKFRQKQFAYQQTRDQANQLLKTLDFDKSGIRPADNQPITDYAHQNLYQYAYDNPEALSPSMSNPTSLKKANQFSQNEAEANYRVARSKQIQAQYQLYKKDFIDKGDADGLQALEEWYKNPDVTKMDDFQYTPQLDYNQQYVYGQLTKDLKPEVGIGKAEFLPGGKVNNPEVTSWSDKNWGLMNDRFDSGWNVDSTFGGKYKEGVQTHFQNAFNGLSDDEKKKWGTPQEYGRYIQLGQQQISSKPNIDAVSYAPVGSGKGATPEEISQRKNLIYQIQNKNEGALDILRGLKYGGVPPASVEYEQSGIKDAPTAIVIKTQPTADTEGKTVRIEVSDKTGGGFLAINQLLNDLEGQAKISVEDLQKIKDVTPQSQRTIVRTGTKDGKKVVQYSDGTIEYAK